MSKFKIYIKSIFLPIIIGIVVGLLTSNSMNYPTLEKPLLTPPGFIFPIVWFVLYTLMGISYAILKTNSLIDIKTSVIYYLQLFVNALWSILFFTLNLRLFSFFWILLLIVLVIFMILTFYKKNKTAGILQIPYLLWITFAAYLNLFIYLLNR